MDLTNKASFQRRKVKAVTVDGDTAYIRVMSGRERDEWATYVSSLSEDDRRTNENVYCFMLVRTLCDKEGTRIFQDTDTSELAGADSKTLAALFEASLEFNSIGAKAEAEIKNG